MFLLFHSLVKNERPIQFWDSETNPDFMSEDDRRAVAGWALSQGLEVTYKHHHYTVGGEVFRQTDGGPQGLKAAVESSEIYMLQFDSKFLSKLEALGFVVYRYKRYVDDICIILPPLKPGWYYCVDRGRMCYSLEHSYSELPGDQRTMSVLRDIADGIDPNLSFTFDCPSLNDSNRMPVLDLQL